MKVLVACEYSGVVRDAFLAEGHDAISCDLLPTESPGAHIQGDVTQILKEPWDLVIAHPPCKYLSTARGTFPRELLPEQGKAIDFFLECYRANAPRVAVENPQVYRSVRRFIGEPDCVAEPHHFGSKYRKRTFFWTRGLPPLMPQGQNPSPEKWVITDGTGGPSGWDMEKRAKIRARFHPEVARAMAKQWGNYQ